MHPVETCKCFMSSLPPFHEVFFQTLFSDTVLCLLPSTFSPLSFRAWPSRHHSYIQYVWAISFYSNWSQGKSKGNVNLYKWIISKVLSMHCQGISQFYLHTLRFIHKRNEPYLPLPSRPQLVLIYRPLRDGRLSRPSWLVGFNLNRWVWARKLIPHLY